MSFSTAYLVPRQLTIWSFRRQGLSQAEIGRRLGVQRQGINGQYHVIDAKVGRALIEAAHSNRLDLRRIDTINGIAEAYSSAYDMPVVISFSKANGVQVWYTYEGTCDRCNRSKTCFAMLKAEAAERGIALSEEDLKLLPAQLGRKIFSTIMQTMEEQ